MKRYSKLNKPPLHGSWGSIPLHETVVKQGVSSKRGSFVNNDEEKELALLSATFANAELRTSRASSTYYADAALKLADANKKLEAEIALRNDEKELREYFQQLEIPIKEQAKLQATFEAALQKTREQSEKEKGELQALLDGKAATIEELQGRVAALEAELQSVSEFLDERYATRKQVEALEADISRAQTSHAHEEHRLRLALMEERVRGRADAQAERTRRDEEVRRLAAVQRDRDALRVSEELADLRRERALLLQEGCAARDEAEALRQQNHALRRRAEVADGTGAESIARGARQRREIAALRAQVRAAEDGLAAAAEQHERRVREMEKAHAAALKRITDEREEAVAAGRAMRRDLVKMRGIARAMIERQTDLELFFHESLAYVRRKALQERRSGNPARSVEFGTSQLVAAEYIRLLPHLEREHLLISNGDEEETNSGDAMKTARGAVSLPLITSNPHSELQRSTVATLREGPFDLTGSASIPSAPVMEDPRSVEISQLSWREKERVLQRLFKKLQGQSKPKPCPYANEMHKIFDGAVAVDPETHVFITDSAH